MRAFLILLFSVFLLQNVRGQQDCSFRYLFIGHAYGSQDTTVAQWQSIQNNIEKIKQLHLEWIVFLGDVMRDTSRKSLYNLHKLFYDFHTPLTYVRGNHDTKWFEQYPRGAKYDRAPQCWEDWAGLMPPPKINGTIDTVFLQTHKPIYKFIAIDTEIPNQNIDSILKAEINQSKATYHIITSHRLIWAYSNSRYKHLAKLTNSEAMHLLPQAVDFDFLNAQKDKKFYFFAGDLGLRIPLFYDNVGNVTLYATGCGGTAKDNALLAEFRRDTIITSLVHLGPDTYNIEDYTLEKINQMPVRYETNAPDEGFKGYKWPVILGIFAMLALCLYMAIKPNE